MRQNRESKQNNYWSGKDISKTKNKFEHLWDIIPKDSFSFLDVGGGGGGFYHTMRKNKGYDYLLLDASGEAISKAKNNGVKALQLDIDEKQWPFEDNSYDIAILSDVLEHLLNPWAVLAETARVTKKYILICGPNFAHWKCRLDTALGRPIRQMVADKNGAVINKEGLHIDHIYFITYKNIIYWSNKLGLELIKSDAFWYRRYFLFRWVLELIFKNWGEVYRVLLKKENTTLNTDDKNFQF